MDNTLFYKLMAITKDDVRRIVKLAKLEFDDSQIERGTKELSAILEYIKILENAPLDGLEPIAHALEVDCPRRDDEIRPSLPPEDALKNAPQKEDAFFKVPEVIED